MKFDEMSRRAQWAFIVLCVKDSDIGHVGHQDIRILAGNYELDFEHFANKVVEVIERETRLAAAKMAADMVLQKSEQIDAIAEKLRELLAASEHIRAIANNELFNIYNSGERDEDEYYAEA